MPVYLGRILALGQALAQRFRIHERMPALLSLPAAGGSGGLGWPGRPGRPDEEERELVQRARAALREWQAAQSRFEMVDGVREPELVDHAVFHLQATQRKYIYLLRQIQRLRAESPSQED